MARYEIEHCCGHTETHYITGSKWYRENRKNILSGRLCKQCWQEENKRKAEELIDKYKGVLPELQGSEKQVRWAVQIRSKALDQLEKFIKAIEEGNERVKERVFPKHGTPLVSPVEQEELITYFAGDPKSYNRKMILNIHYEYLSDYLKKVLDVLKKQDKATFWINNRDVFNRIEYPGTFPTVGFRKIIGELEGINRYWINLFMKKIKEMRKKNG